MTTSYGRGASYLKQRRESGRRSGDRMMSFWPSTREIYQIWFMDELDNFIVPLIHPMTKKRKDGSQYSIDMLCKRPTDDAPVELCPYCVAGEKGPWPRMCALVWVEQSYHHQPPADGKIPDGWQPIRRAGTDQRMWLEKIGQVRFWIMKDKMVDQIESAFYGDPDDAARAPTLLDRPFRVEGSGEGSSRIDVLKALDRKEQPPELKEAIASTPPLEQVMVDKLGDGKSQSQTTYATVSEPELFEDGDPGPVEPDDAELITF